MRHLPASLKLTAHQLLLHSFGTSFCKRAFGASAVCCGREDHQGEEIKAARQWLSTFTPDTIPKDLSELTFSRASGPGGQNVNKVNSKATLRLPLSSLLPLLPQVMHAHIRASRYCKAASDTIVIQADESRKQKDNAHGCFVKLHEMIKAAAHSSIPGETSAAQKQHVKDLEMAANERRLKSKKVASSKKSARRGSGSDD